MNFARDFVASRKSWLEKQWRILETRKIPPQLLQPGMEILFRGEPVVLRVEQDGPGLAIAVWRGIGAAGRLGWQSSSRLGRPSAKNCQNRIGPIRARELAGAHHLEVKRVSVRNQKAVGVRVRIMAPFP